MEKLNILSAFIQTYSWQLVITNLTGKKIKFKKTLNLFLIIFLALIVYFISCFNFGILKPIIIYCLITIFYKFIFNITFSESSIINLISMGLHLIAETFMAIVILIINIDSALIHKIFNFTPLSAIFILTIIYFILKIFHNKLEKFKNFMLNEKITYGFYIIFLLSTSFLLFKNLNLSNVWKNNIRLWMNIITLIIFIVLSILVIYEKMKVNKSNKQFNELFNQSEEVASLLENYQKINHENKNELKIIREKIKNDTELKKYIDLIIREKNINEEEKWIGDLVKIKDVAIKGFLSLKINNMIDNSVNVFTIINKNVKNFKFDKYSHKEYRDICRLLGIYIDNAYEASIESRKKEVTIEMSNKNNILTIIISNTFKNKPDIKNIDNIKYTTKGVEHGVGRSLAKEIINKNSFLNQKTEIIKNYFYQYLYIKNK